MMNNVNLQPQLHANVQNTDGPKSIQTVEELERSLMHTRQESRLKPIGPPSSQPFQVSKSILYIKGPLTEVLQP